MIAAMPDYLGSFQAWAARMAAVLAVILIFAAGAGPARASATSYDIAVLLYQTHPWIGNRLPAAAAHRAHAPAGVDRWNTVPPIVAPGAGPYSAAQLARKGSGPQVKQPGPYSFFVYGGIASEENFFQVHQFNTADVQLAALGATARLYTFDFGLEVEAEAGVGRRFGQDKLWEFWVAAGLRWRDFPWNDVVTTTVALSLIGLNYTTELPPHEKEFLDNDDAQVLNFFTPEITLSLPGHPDVALLLRLHHRSPIFGIFDSGSATFYSAGLRFTL